MIDLFDWPAFDREAMFALNKVINEPDFYPLFLVRHLVEAAKLARKRKHKTPCDRSPERRLGSGAAKGRPN
jgi:hypothetical protein